MTRYLPVLATALVFAAAYALCAVQFPAFLSTRVVGNLLTDNAFLGIAAVGMTFVILSGGIDLSVGSIIAFTGVLVAVLISWYGLHPLAAFAVALVVSTAFGAAMGAAIHYLDVPSFIVTLAGMFLARGMAFVITTDSIPVSHEFYTAVQRLYVLMPGGGLLAEHVPWLVRAGVRTFHLDEQLRPGGSRKAYVDAGLTRSWRRLLDDDDPILRMDVVRALVDLGDARSRTALRARLDVDLDARVRRRIKEALRDLGAERKRDEQLKEDVEKLQTEHAELKARVAKIEARAAVRKKKEDKGGASKRVAADKARRRR